MLSLITLVDSTEHLAELQESVVSQSMADWEWLIAPLVTIALPAGFDDDRRIRVVALPQAVIALGHAASKKFLCEKSAGAHLVDLDQHDVLVPGALQAIADAAANGDPAVIYGDTVPDVGTSSIDATFPANVGWETYDAYFGEGRHVALRAFDPTPAAVATAAYAPLDGLVWRRDAYLALDGHDSGRGRAADVDLLCRAYLAGHELRHLPTCLVVSRRSRFQRRDGDADQHVTNVYIYALIREWCRREGLRMADLGGAHNAPTGYETVDLADADINCDIRYGLPVPDGSLGCVRAVDFLEHMNHCPDSTCVHGADGGPRCMVGIMNELYRVLAPGGWLVSSTPSSDGRGAFQDPTHVSYWNPNSFWYYTRSDQARFVRGVTCRFQGTRVWQSYPSPWHEANKILYVNADLVALKGQRQPGLVEI
jgi:O-antigen biosynthesis protein